MLGEPYRNEPTPDFLPSANKYEDRPKSLLFTTARHLMIDRARRNRIVPIDLLEDLDSLNVLGVTGASYGGYMSAWLITQDERFAAAVAVAPVTNKVTQRFLSNIPHFVDLFLADVRTPE